ncbi:MAG: cytochrome c biogenesis protein CcdA [Cyclobacteriaceae bacterium]
MKYSFVFILSLFTLITSAQILDPAKWELETSKSEVTIGDEVDLIFKVVLDDTWYIYSSDFSKDVGPKVTEFWFTENDTYELVGGIRPINPKRKYDDIFEGEVSYFEYDAEFRQTVKILAENPVIAGEYEYQVCTTVDGKCIPGDGAFSFEDIKAVPAPEPVVEEQKPEVNKIEESKQPTEPEKVQEVKSADPVITELPNSDKVKDAEEPLEEFAKEEVVVEAFDSVKAVGQVDSSEVSKDPLVSTAEEEVLPAENSSLFGFAILAFLAGLAALLTPCVFPMIPMTVTFFTKSANSKAGSIKQGVLYGLSIIVIYTLSGTIVSWINGPEFANWLSTHWLPNLFFFGIFIVFALSFLGMFEIVLPSSLVNKVDEKSEKGGLIGIFFMAFTIVLVSFSCTGPIVGSILVASAGGAIIKPIVGMFSFSLALALPFALFAIFPQWLQRLPKSGGWLNSVKVILGFLELALGLKFLSVADQVYHWGILDREVYLALWIVIFSLIGLYLLGKITLPHDSKMDRIGVPRLVLAIVTFSFVVYLIPGMFGAPLKALAGYLPPMTTMDWNMSQSSSPISQESTICEAPKHAEILHFPHGIQGYFDLDQALQCSEQQGKPVFIDFTGHGCVNCREMEARVWSDPEVLKRLKNEFVVLALYVDDKTELPETEWYTSSYDGKVKKTIGKQNADHQIVKYNNNAQPLYILMDEDQNLLAQPRAYDLSVSAFIEFLDKGVAEYQKRKQNQ